MPARNQGGVGQTATPRVTTIAGKTAWCKRMPFTPRNDHTPRFADGLAVQNPAARTTPVAPFWPPGLPEGRTGRRGYPCLRHARPEPRRAGQTIETRGQSRAGKTAWRKRIGRRMEQPSHARRRTKKPEPATGPISRKAKRGNHAEQDNHGPKFPANLPPDEPLLFLRSRPTPELRGAGGRTSQKTG